MVGFGIRLLRTLVLSAVLCMLVPPLYAYAYGSWKSGDFTWGESKKLPSLTYEERCQPTNVTVVGVTSLNEFAQVCVYERPDFRYAIYNKYINLGYGGYTNRYFVASLGSDRNMYVIDGINTSQQPLDVPSSNDLHFNTLTMGFTNNHLLSYIPNLPTKLYKTTSLDQPTRYQLVEGAEQPFIPYNRANTVTTGAVGVSEDGDWIVAEVMGAGLVRINTATRYIQGFSNYAHRYGVGSDAHMTFRITNDGTKVAAFDYNITPVVYTLESDCLVGTDVYSEAFAVSLHRQSCPSDEMRLYDALNQRYTPQLARGMNASGFNLDGDTLYFDNYVYEDENDWMNPTVYRTPLYAGGYRADEGLDYLALGDSYASGEGDIQTMPDDSTYYLEGTEGKGQCHISNRSYPFLLRDDKDISPTRMHSVACSGAEILPDYMGLAETYLGQGKRLANLSASDRKMAKDGALYSFAPGNLPQLEFVKKYQPKVITLMGGGNDVGFARILEYCATPSWEGVFVDNTCGYAVEGSPLRAMLAQSIQSQYEYTLLLLRKIRQASPGTTVYVIGYPSFISGDPGANCFNSAALDGEERTMINEGVAFMNSALEAAATSMGVHYIDIQDVLEGGRLCEGSEYVTGLSDIRYDLEDHSSEVFHPNAKAHDKIARRIVAQGFQVEPGRNSETLSEPIDPMLPSYFSGTERKQTMQYDVTTDSLTEERMMPIDMPEGSLAASSSAILTIYSDAVDLGSVSVNSAGGIKDTLALPSSLKPGRHVLTIDGLSPSGEPVEYFQFVTVASRTPSDEDGDGIADADDQCPFLTSWIDETNQQDICVSSAPGETTTAPSDDRTGSASPQPNTRSGQDTPISSRKNTSQAVATLRNETTSNSNGDATESAGEVLGVHRDSPLALHESSRNNGFIVGIIVLLSTLTAGYGIVRHTRRRS